MVEPLGSDVPLTEDILKKKTEFVKSWVEWAADNTDQVFRGFNSVSPGSSILYSVPKNSSFFLTGACITLAATGSSNANRATFISGDDKTGNVLSVLTHHADTTATNSLSYPMPIRFDKKVILAVPNASFVYGTIVGFTIPKRIS